MHDNTGPAAPERKAKQTARRKIVTHAPGAPFFEEPVIWRRLKTLFPYIVNDTKENDVLLQIDRRPLKQPSRGVRSSTAITSKANIKTINANYNSLPDVVRQWINRTRRAIGLHWKVKGYVKPEDPTSADCPEHVLQYLCKKQETHHYVLTGDIDDEKTFSTIQMLPERDCVFRACCLQLNAEHSEERLSSLFANICAVSETKCVLLVSVLFCIHICYSECFLYWHSVVCRLPLADMHAYVPVA